MRYIIQHVAGCIHAVLKHPIGIGAGNWRVVGAKNRNGQSRVGSGGPVRSGIPERFDQCFVGIKRVHGSIVSIQRVGICAVRVNHERAIGAHKGTCCRDRQRFDIYVRISHIAAHCCVRCSQMGYRRQYITACRWVRADRNVKDPVGVVIGNGRIICTEDRNGQRGGS